MAATSYHVAQSRSKAGDVYGYQIAPIVLWPGFAPRPVPTHLHVCGGLFNPSSVDKSDKWAAGLEPGHLGSKTLSSLSHSYRGCFMKAAVSGGEELLQCCCSPRCPPPPPLPPLGDGRLSQIPRTFNDIALDVKGLHVMGASAVML